MISESGGAGLAPVVALRRLTRWARTSGSCGSGSSTASRRFRDVLRMGRRAVLEHPAAVRHARRGHEGSVRVRRRARVRVPHPLVPRGGGRRPPTYFETRIEILTARLEALQQTVSDLVSDDDLEARARRASCRRPARSRAPVFVLALEALPARRQARLRSRHRTTTQANRARGSSCSPKRTTPTSTTSSSRCNRSRRRYGRLCAVNPVGRFFPQERVVLAGLRRGSSPPRSTPRPRVEEPRRQAQTARALLELSNSLAEHRHRRRDGRAHRPGGHRRDRLRPRRGDPVRARRRDRPVSSRPTGYTIEDEVAAAARWTCRSRRSASGSLGVNVWDRDGRGRSPDACRG